MSVYNLFTDEVDAEGEPDDTYDPEPTPKANGSPSLTIKIPPGMARSVVDAHVGARRSSRLASSSTHLPSGSEYNENSPTNSNASSVDSMPKKRTKRNAIEYLSDEQDYGEKEPEIIEFKTSSGRVTKRKPIIESDDDDLEVNVLRKNSKHISHTVTTRSLRSTSRQHVHSDDDEDASLAQRTRSLRHATRSQSKNNANADSTDANDTYAETYEMGSDLENVRPIRGRLTRSKGSKLRSMRSRRKEDEGNGYVDDGGDGGSSEDEGHQTPIDDDDLIEEPGSKRVLRARKRVNYAIPPPLEEMPQPPNQASRPKPNRGGSRRGPGWSANGTVLSRYMGMPVPDDSDSDVPSRTPGKGFGARAGAAGAGGGIFAGTGGLYPDTLAAAGTPSNLGKVTSESALADADPLGVNQNVTFDEVGGLDDHINSLKEMTLLPLLYPEVFHRFSLVPPRGVLFHGPPGTGKTLLARALAASCRANGKGISFFMRKGADCLSKWVGEAERQLRLLFEEARNQQPSIIFFDEIDGLAPVRSSKQDQIHASIVSTLLALMDGMDGRGQVVVIGATNRPDAVDPALRRPGRFDREFYFPLPNAEAREKILTINTRKWEGWDSEKAKETIQQLAKLTKGYGGADLRALCTEAALNAVQRRYPQIYKSTDRLLLNPETIGVQARDFMISVKKLVPSSARSTASSAAPLPSQLAPLLDEALQQVKAVLDKALPLGRKRTALEEAEFEDDEPDGALEREILMQKMDSLRVYRPRVVLYGEHSMGQSYVGAAALHHLEGCHVQTLDLGSLMGDSTRTVEAGIVQLFVEAKRHQPSIIYVPSLAGWCAAVTETARTTVKAMLDSISPSEPILLLAVVDGQFTSLPRDVRAWFGMSKENRISFKFPDFSKRRAFFDELLGDVRRPPSQFPDGVKRKKRILEQLPIAPPLEPRKPSAAELALQEENDHRIIAVLKFRLGPILAELKRKHKRFTKSFMDEYNVYPDSAWQVFGAPPPSQTLQPNGMPAANSINGVNHDGQGLDVQIQPPTPAQEPQIFPVDLETVNADLYKGKFLTPRMFLEEVEKMVHNARIRELEDRDRLNKALAMYTAAEVSIQEFDAGFRLECERMAERETRRREQRRAEKRKSRQASREQSVNGNVSATENGVLRRSARANGQAPEINITDPLLLERQLRGKRARSQDPNGETMPAEPSDDRDLKRSRLETVMEVDNEDGERDELDILGKGPNSSVPRPIPSRAAIHIEPLDEDMDALYQTPSKPHNTNNSFSTQSRTGDLSRILNSTSPIEPMPDLTRFRQPTDSSQNTQGIAPSSSYNQLQPFGVDGTDGGISTPLPSVPSSFAISPAQYTRRFVPEPDPQIVGPLTPNHPHTPHRVSPIHIDPPDGQTIDASGSSSAQQPLPPLDNGSFTSGQEESATMETTPIREKTPSPPPPDFHVDETLLKQLEESFVQHTDHLNVEQLEQLRATSLNCIWKHRQEWDRDACVKELFTVITDFAQDVAEVDMTDDDAGL